VSSVIGVDLGGTKVIVACLRGNQLSESLLEPTDRTASTPLIDQLVAMVNRIRSDDLAAVGIGVPSVVEFETGRVVSSVNIPLTDVPLRQVLGERLGVPVFVDNDATVAALAEAHDSEMRLVAQNLVMITIGTGVGGGIVLGGRIYRGATGGAGELGQSPHRHRGLGSPSRDRSSSKPPATRSIALPLRRRQPSPPPTSVSGWLRESPCSGPRRSRRLSAAIRWRRESSRYGPSGLASASPMRSTPSIPRRS
jgi:glucokinase